MKLPEDRIHCRAAVGCVEPCTLPEKLLRANDDASFESDMSQVYVSVIPIVSFSHMRTDN